MVNQWNDCWTGIERKLVPGLNPPGCMDRTESLHFYFCPTIVPIEATRKALVLGQGWTFILG
ncbi:hypothetical protein JH63_14715 [Listeria monocytogenes]|nr:hypothetical protein [Listeria monocytogenes]